MKTQQDMIRKMSMKKLLNGEQKKVLYRLFEAEISKEVSSVMDKRKKLREKLIEEIENEANKNKNNASMVKEYNTNIYRNDVIRKTLEANGYTVQTAYGSSNKIIKLSVSYSHKKILSLSREDTKIKNEMNGLKLQLLADVYGLPLTYKEMVNYVRKQLEKIEKMAK